ncbi:hypothetical protein PCCS19_00520 [Paenibacillus sp. CCS19]|uniref:phosphopantetheine-binding protein n=1 Tax=Paenibacillus sp. CCS19 TaxID=3158387 RepID=UPI0025697A13|nr:phosphopantetheine-binding protein [Paenibacillus cellulosilyticus]GMK36999.1 hypothetical protein PCCS19_00520 [Paenibacillus cellulosilyticus]
MNLLQQIKELVRQARLFPHDGEVDDDDASLLLDSMSTILLITSFEDKFGITIDYRTVDLNSFQSIRSIEQLVASHMQEGVR